MNLTGKALRDRAAQLKIRGRSKMTADELRAAVLAASAPDTPWVEATGNVAAGDTIRFTEDVWGGSRRRPRHLGQRTIIARVLKDSYGAQRQQHTFTLQVIDSTGLESIAAGTVLRRKGRNVYRHGTERRLWQDEQARREALAEKHLRGDAARTSRRRRRDRDRRREGGW